MNTPGFRVSPLDYPHKQIERHFEELIYSGKLKGGERLETTEELARRYGVTKNTVHKSLVSLTRRGLLIRSQKRGTLVKPGVCCRTIGIVVQVDDLINPNHVFWASLYKEIERIAQEESWNCKLYLGASNERLAETIRELERDIADGKIKAIVALSISGSLFNWLNNSCTVPWTLNSSSSSLDMRVFSETGISYLLSQGRKNICIVSNGLDKELKEVLGRFDGDPSAGLKYHVTKACVGRIRGYELTKEIFASGERCHDAMFFFDDRACEGAVKAIFELGVGVPDEIAVLSWAASGVEIFSPVPISTVEYDIQEMADAIVKDLANQIEGRERVKPLIGFKLCPRASCGEKKVAVA